MSHEGVAHETTLAHSTPRPGPSGPHLSSRRLNRELLRVSVGDRNRSLSGDPRLGPRRKLPTAHLEISQHCDTFTLT